MSTRLNFKKRLTRKKPLRLFSGAILEENIAALVLLFIFLFFPFLDLATMGMRAFFLWFACEQAAMAGAKGTVWSTSSTIAANAGGAYSGYANSYYTSIQDQATNTAKQVIAMFSGVTVTSGPTLVVIAEAIPETNGSTMNPYVPSTSTYLDKSMYVPILQVTMTGSVQPFITIPFLPWGVPGLNTPATITVSSQQQIENPTALSY